MSFVYFFLSFFQFLFFSSFLKIYLIYSQNPFIFSSFLREQLTHFHFGPLSPPQLLLCSLNCFWLIFFLWFFLEVSQFWKFINMHTIREKVKTNKMTKNWLNCIENVKGKRKEKMFEGPNSSHKKISILVSMNSSWRWEFNGGSFALYPCRKI